MLMSVALGCGRLGQAYLLEPDSPDYVLMARMLVTRWEYRAPYNPTGVAFTWRPPGLGLLLAPAAVLGPYDIVAAKSLMLAWGIAFVGVFYFLIRGCGQSSYVIGAWALVAFSPYTLLWSTEVLSEVPFAALVLAIVGLVGSASSSDRRWVGAALLLGLLPLLRTVGLTIWLACAAWVVLSRRPSMPLRLLLLAASLIPEGIWSLRNQGSAEESYLSFLWRYVGDTSLRETFHQIVGSALLNYKILVGLFVPGGTSDRPVYDFTTIGPTVLPIGFWPLASLFASAVLATCCLGLWVRREQGGKLAGLMLLFYLLSLALWPSHHERFLWPVVPLLMTFFPAGLDRAIDSLKRRSVLFARRVHQSALALVAGLLCWQFLISAGMVWTNWKHHSDPDGAVPNRYPGYFADWNAAGKWLRAHSHPYDRVITARVELACTSGRFQRWVLADPTDLPTKVRSFTARYVVFPSDYHGALLPPWLVPKQA